MSLESALDEERREVLKLLEPSRPQRQSRGSISLGSGSSFDPHGRNDSPIGARPIKSMLDIDDEPPAAATANAPSAKTPTQGPVRSLLDLSASPPPPPASGTVNTSPIDTTYEYRKRHRGSDASSHLSVGSGPRLLRDRDKPQPASIPSPNADFSFAMTPTNQGISLPKRVSQGGRKSGVFPNSMARVMQAMELGGDSGPILGNERGRMSMPESGTTGHGHSISPSTRFGRSQSPHTNMLNTNSMNLMPTPGKFMSDEGDMVDLNLAYRRLSDAHLATSGGSLSNLPVRRESDASKLDNEGTTSPGEGDRLHEDFAFEHDEEHAVESSDEGSGGDSGGEYTENGRGRIKDGKNNQGEPESEGPAGLGKAKGPRKTLSLLAAAEEERQQVSAKYKVKSLLGPPVTVTSPSGERLSPRKPGVHPTTSFDQGTSTPVTSDDEEDMSDLRRAQRMHLNISNIQSTPDSHRSLRTVVRGEFDKIMDEIDEGLRRARTYLVATDLSDEAAYALEWTIGTILRDGDTMLAVYAMDEESSGGSSGKGGDGGDGGLGIGEGALAVKDQAAIVGSLTSKLMSSRNLSPLSANFGIGGGGSEQHSNTSTSASPDSRNMSKSEQERVRATEDITQRCVKLLRKTRLQVRVVIEVIHCKSPKHLITEVIDFIDPTLVILGSRGRSALKGVLLGSFSNYLVTKSSVPVMVARKRLKKHSKFKKTTTTNVRQANNITASVKTLAAAKID